MSEFLGTIEPWAALWGESIWRASLAGGVAIGAAWAISRWCRFLSARVTCWIWRLACLKLLVALICVQPVDLPLLAAKPSETPTVQAEPPAARVSRAVVNVLPAEAVPGIVHQINFTEPATSVGTLVFLLWTMGVLWCALRTARQWRAVHRVRRAAEPARSALLLRELREEAGRLGIRRLPQLCLSRQADNVQLVGVWRPAIILRENAEEAFDEGERRLILAHELAHLKRRDLVWNWLPTVTGGLFFFHPLAWILVRRWCDTQEAACDELVMKYHGARRAQYGRLLLKMCTRRTDPPHSALFAAGISGTFRRLEWRIVVLTRTKTPSTRQLAVAAAAVCLLAVGGLIPWRLVAQEPARPGLPAAAPSRQAGATGFAATQLQNTSTQSTSGTSNTSLDGTISSSSSSTTGTVAMERLSGKIYVRAGLQVKIKTGGTEKFVGVIAIDPNTGAWERLALDGSLMRVSPQQDRLAFCKFAGHRGNRAVKLDLYVVDVHGKNLSKVVDDARLPMWSPEGKRLLFTRTLKPADRMKEATWIVDLALKQSKQLPIPSTDEVDDWSRDGEWLVTVSDRHPPFGSGYQLYVMHPDGTQERRITQEGGLNCYPRFRPGTNQILYHHQGHGFDSLWLVDIDGGNRKQLLTSDKEGVGAPEDAYWSADGKWIAVSRFDWQTSISGTLNPTKEKVKVPGYGNDRIEIISADGSSRGILKLAGVTHVDWIEHGDWR